MAVDEEGSHAVSGPISCPRVVLPLEGRKLPLIWIGTNCSCDNTISFMNTASPSVRQAFEQMVDLLYSNGFMAAQGQSALDVLDWAATAYAGQYVLVVEGAIPIKDDGLYTVVARRASGPLTALDAVGWLGASAAHVIALGTCGCFGGATAARPDITGSVSVQSVLGRQVINVSGCPVNPEWYVGTLAHLLYYGMPELDRLGRPLTFYGFTVHRHCQRRSYFDDGEFAERLGDIECMFSQGCVGPRTGADCPYRQWIEGVSWPVKANTPCIGCTNEDFPDGASPFFTPMPQKAGRQRP